MLLALSGGQKLGIALAAAAFIGFALASSFYFPRGDPNFPGRRLRLFVVVSVLFFAGMLTAMILLAREEPEGEAHGIPPTDTVATGTSATTGGPGETETGAGGEGDPEAGRALFDEQGCGGCHVFAPAKSEGQTGPNLNELEALAAKAQKPLEAFVRESIVDPSAYLEPGYADVMPKTFSQLPKEQLDSLVQYLASGAGGAGG